MENSAQWIRCLYQTKNTICVGAFLFEKQHFAWLVLVRSWFSAGFLSTCAREEKRTIILHSGFQSEQEWRHNAFHSLVGLFATKVAVSLRLQKNCLFFFKFRLQTSQVYSDINWKCVRLASCRKSKLCQRKEKKTMDATMRYRSFEENCKYWTRHVTKPNNYKVFC